MTSNVNQKVVKHEVHSIVHFQNGSTYIELNLDDGTQKKIQCVVFPEKKTTSFLKEIEEVAECN
jgi:hypothetical protein